MVSNIVGGLLFVARSPTFLTIFGDLKVSYLYSRGINTYDKTPAQLSADSFDEFAKAIANDKSSHKGLTYICSSLSQGLHYQKPEENPGINNWRLKRYAQPRQFLPFDFDGFESPEVFGQVCEFLSVYDCLIYTTASHTEDAPRARAILALSRAADPEEGEQLGRAMQMHIESKIGIDKIKFDTSVYRAIQPIYTPVTTSKIIRHNGKALEVDETLVNYSTTSSKPNTASAGILSSIFKPAFQLPDTVIGEGKRNEMMLRYVGHLRGRGFKEDEIVVQAMAMNKARLSPMLDEDEILDICSRYQHQNQAFSDDLGSIPPQFNLSAPFDIARGNLQVLTTAPPKRQYVFSDQATLGTVSVLGGSGGVSKTMLTLQIAVASACGKDLGHIQVAEGSSLLFLGEEDEAERDRRIGAICTYMNANPLLVAERIKCFGAAGADIRLTKKSDANAQATNLSEKVIQIAREHAETCRSPLKFIVFDHARLVLGGDPNDAEDVTQLTRVLTHIARETGAAVFLLAHSPKSVISKQGIEMSSADIAGSAAFVDNSRAAFMMWTMRDDEAKNHRVSSTERNQYVRLENVKANYANTGGGYWLKRIYIPEWDVAVLEPIYLQSKNIFQAKSVDELQDRILHELRKKQGGVSERNLRDISGKDRTLGASESKVRAAIDTMLKEGVIEKRAPTPEEKKTHRLAGQVQWVLVACTP